MSVISSSFNDLRACGGGRYFSDGLCYRICVPSAASGLLGLGKVASDQGYRGLLGKYVSRSLRIRSGLGVSGGTGLINADPQKSSDTSSLTPNQCEQQVQRILKSATFRNAVTLQQLLQFLTARAFEGGADGLKEYTIGVEAFGRPQDFDPKTDTIVRVQIHRLRQKLTEYYEADGSRDPILVEIPKGHYLPTFEPIADSDRNINRDSGPELNTGVPAVTPQIGPNISGVGSVAGLEKRRRSRSFLARTTIAAAAVMIVFAAGFLIGRKQLRNAAAGIPSVASAQLALGNSADPVKAFWASFLGNDSAPVIAYPDAVFLLDDSNDLFRFRRGASDDRGALVDPHLAQQFASNPGLVAKAGQLYYENGYTGAGELQAIAMLSSLFGQMGVKATVKPSRDITPDDLRQHNVILLGSPFQNVAVAQLITQGDFNFKNPDSRHEQWRAQIVNAHPRTNEASAYGTERDPSTQALRADYGLVTIQSGVIPGRYIAVLGGLDTTGTEGVTLFATSRPGIEDLSRVLSASGSSGEKGEMPLFQALIRVRLEKGYDVLGATLVAVHGLPPQNGHGTGGAAPQTPAH